MISQYLKLEVGGGKTVAPILPQDLCKPRAADLSCVRQGRKGFLAAAGLPALPFHQMWSKWTLHLAELGAAGPQITYTNTCLHSFLPCKTTGMTAVGVERGIHSPSGIYACAWLSSFIKADIRKLQKQERQQESVNTAPKNAAVPSVLIPASTMRTDPAEG